MKSALFLSLILVATALAAFAQNPEQGAPEQPEQYSATAFVTSGPAQGKSVSINIYINSYTTDAEVNEYLDILKSKGQDGLVSAFDKTKSRGRIAVVGTTGNDLPFIRSRNDEGKRVVHLATDRIMSFPELWNQPRSTDYKFTIAELRLDANGNGEGTLMYATKLSFNKQGQLQLEYYGQTPVRLANVRRMK